jgi:hypothetical protein
VREDDQNRPNRHRGATRLKCPIWCSYLETHRPFCEPMAGFAHLAQTSAEHRLAPPWDSTSGHRLNEVPLAMSLPAAVFWRDDRPNIWAPGPPIGCRSVGCSRKWRLHKAFCFRARDDQPIFSERPACRGNRAMLTEPVLIGDSNELIYLKPSKWNCADEGSAV